MLTHNFPPIFEVPLPYGDGAKPHIFRCTWVGHSGRWRYRCGGYLHPQSFAWPGLVLQLKSAYGEHGNTHNRTR